jgi:hypothetical protein
MVSTPSQCHVSLFLGECVEAVDGGIDIVVDERLGFDTSVSNVAGCGGPASSRWRESRHLAIGEEVDDCW